MFEPADDTPLRAQFLQKAIDMTLGARQDSYGSFYANMDATAGLFTAYCKAKYGECMVGEDAFTFTAQDVAFFLSLLKMARTFQSARPHEDNYIDGACYFAMAGEAATEDDDGK